ncbi:MAG: hypothetical protein D3903_13695 [Candidatus Electrothrix sp. GM3_4]|nr:hypothetical protein [Candidatus Electrothrix sp. GM3_4]
MNPALPYSVFLLKYKNPVSVHWDSELGALIFSSRYLFLRKTFGRSAITDFQEGPVLCLMSECSANTKNTLSISSLCSVMQKNK